MIDTLKDVLWPEVPFDLEKALVLVVRRGSEAHGLFIAPDEEMGTDDRDLIAVVVPPLEYLMGLSDDRHKTWRKQERQQIRGPWDVIVYDLRKFARLLTEQNANILSALWADPSDVLYATEVGEMFLRRRLLFRASGPARSSFIGYAHDQIEKMMSGTLGTGYMGEKRRMLKERLGFDPKHACHCIRLLRMGAEYLTTGEMQVRRSTDRAVLIAIKQGRIPLPEIKALADEALQRLLAAPVDGVMPDHVDRDEVDSVLVYAMLLHHQLECWA